MHKTAEPLLSIVIPTRARIETLRSCLKTCVEQDFDRCEFVVSDNVSNDGTEDLVRDICRSDARFKYFNPGRRLGMAENYEFALSKAQGRYIGYIGDDDGLIPGGLKKLSAVIAQENPGAIISSCRPHYIWPGAKDPDGHLFIPPRLGGKRIQRFCGKNELIHFAGCGKSNYLSLPSVYYGFCSRMTIDTARGKNGRFFNSCTPDVYSAAAVAAVTDYISVPFAFTMVGVSRNSIGMYLHESVDLDNQAIKNFYFENKILCHPLVAQSFSLPLTICEALFQVRDNVLSCVERDMDLKINVSAYLLTAMRHASTQSFSFYDKVKKDVMETGRRNGLKQAILSAIGRYPHLGYLPIDITPRTLLFSYSALKGNKILNIHSAVKAYISFVKKITIFPSISGTISFLLSGIRHPIYWQKYICYRIAQIAVDRSSSSIESTLKV
jgi:glycosyltransferase involved in cell wall biosynthesis